MKNQSRKLLAFLLMSLFLLPAPHLVANAQEAGAKPAPDKPPTESKEERELRKREENLNKKEEERKRKETRDRANEAKSYKTLTEFAEDLYASDSDFREHVDYWYIQVQSGHAAEAYRINTSRRKQTLM